MLTNNLISSNKFKTSFDLASASTSIMFKKPLSNLKTSAPLRSSDRRKLKQRATAAYNLTPEEGDILVPDGILSVKFSTHVDEPGVSNGKRGFDGSLSFITGCVSER